MNENSKVVFFTGAGISSAAGIKTFRDNDGLWHNHKVEDVATPEAWASNPKLVLEFYNQRRRQLKDVKPTKAHEAIAQLEKHACDVTVITQNVDDLHERSGSKHIIHLHGQLTQARSEKDDRVILDIGYEDIKMGDTAKDGEQLRPNIVWFGEEVPMMEKAYAIASQADIFIVIGTSLNVYPAAGLLHHVKEEAEIWIIDPKPNNFFPNRINEIALNADEGVHYLFNLKNWY